MFILVQEKFISDIFADYLLDTFKLKMDPFYPNTS